MNNEFDWWLLIVGLVGGAGLVWLVLSSGRETSDPVDSESRHAEAGWIAGRLRASGTDVDEELTEAVLALHRDWETGGGEIAWDWAPPAASVHDLPEAGSSIEPGADEPAAPEPTDAPPSGVQRPLGSASRPFDPPA